MTAGYSYENHTRTHNGITLNIINRSPVFVLDEKVSLKTEKKYQLYDVFSKYITNAPDIQNVCFHNKETHG